MYLRQSRQQNLWGRWLLRDRRYCRHFYNQVAYQCSSPFGLAASRPVLLRSVLQFRARTRGIICFATFAFGEIVRQHF
jgi:hypothetical protein